MCHMLTQQTQIKINLPLSLKEYLESKAQKFGLPMASYVRHLILNDVKEMVFPEYKMSDRTEKKVQKAMKEKNRSIVVADIDQTFRNL